MQTADYWLDAKDYLSEQDAVLKTLIVRFPELTLSSRGNAFETLLRSIVGQQISVKAADSVWQKIITLLPKLTPNQVLKTEFEILRQCGLSQQKTNYIINIAQYFSSNKINSAQYWQDTPYAKIKSDLIQIKGVGEWTVEMFAMFYLLEADIFPIKDLGLIKAINLAYGNNNKPLSLAQIKKISNKWKPYRSVASWYLWRSIDAEAINY